MSIVDREELQKSSSGPHKIYSSSKNVSEDTRHRLGQESSIFDYVFTDEEELIDEINYEAPIGKSDHVCLSWNMSVEMTEPAIDEEIELLERRLRENIC